MSNSSLPDQSAREAIVSDLDTCMLVEAGAGSGKTTSMVARMVELLAEGKVDIERMAAVTFTRKAAAHLRGKFQIALEKQLRENDDAQRQERLRSALSRLERCFIGTIHSFCGRLLRERPVEAGVDPNFVELEDFDDALMARQVFEEHLQQLYLQESSPVLEALGEIGVRPSQLYKTYREISRNPEIPVNAVPVSVPDFSGARSAIRDFLQSYRNDLPAQAPPDGWDALQAILRRAFRLNNQPGISEPARFAELLVSLDRSASITLKRWHDGDRAKVIRDHFEDLQQNVVRPALCGWREHCHSILMDLACPVAKAFRAQRWRKGSLNFQDLLLTASNLLRNNNEVRGYFQERFSHLLIDEFQDTDPVQAEIMFYLTGEDLNEKNWQKLKPRSGSLFVVGDPKQSIYRFRRADIEIYNRVKELIVAGGGGIVQLQTNFRSTGKICEWVNRVYRTIFPEVALPSQAAFGEMEVSRSEGDPDGGVRFIEIPKVKYNKPAEIARLDSVMIGSWIRHALDTKKSVEDEDGSTRPIQPKDVLIICPQKGNLRLYARDLEKRNIPFETTGGGAFSESAELHALMPFLRCLVDPDDEVSLVAFLRGPLCGISDETLFRFKTTSGVFRYPVPISDDVESDAGTEIEAAFEMLKAAREISRRLPPAGALETIIEKLGLVPSGLEQPLGETRAGNLLKAVELARNLAVRGASFVEIVDYLAEVITEDSEQVLEEMSIQPGRSDAVRLMNLHQAKGLEAPVVFLADPLRFARYAPTSFIDRKAEPPAGYYVVNAQATFGHDLLGLPVDWENLESVEAQFQSAEHDRQRYVAATRARDLLVISTYPSKQGPDDGFWTAFVPFLDEKAKLEIIPDDADEKSAPAPAPFTRDDLSRAMRTVDKRVAASGEPGYRIENVTHLVKEQAETALDREDTGKGMSWGRVIHRALEANAVGAVSDPGRFIDNLLREEGRPISERGEVLQVVDGVLSSPLWIRMMNSVRRYVEVPFGVSTSPARLGLQGGPEETILSGVIDLVFEEEDGWVIVDFKTDAVGDDLKPLVNYYAPQIDLYRNFWQELSGGRVKEAGLYFVSLGEFVGV